MGGDTQFPNPAQNCDSQYPGAPSQGCWGTLRCNGVGTCKDTGYCESGNAGAYLGGLCIQNGAGGTFKYCGYGTFTPTPPPSTSEPTTRPSKQPSTQPSTRPSPQPSTKRPSNPPTTATPTSAGETQSPSPAPTPEPTGAPSPAPSPAPTGAPTPFPSPFPTQLPSNFVPFSRDRVCVDSVDIATGVVPGATEDTTGQSAAENGGSGGGGGGGKGMGKRPHKNGTARVRAGKPLKPGQKLRLTQKIRSNVKLANTLYAMVLPGPVTLVRTHTWPKSTFYNAKRAQRRKPPTASLYFDEAQNTLYWNSGEIVAGKKYAISVLVRMGEKKATDDSYPRLPPLPRQYNVPTPAPPQSATYSDFRTYFAVLEEEPSASNRDYLTITCRKASSIQVPVQA